MLKQARQIFEILNRKERRQLLILLFFMFIGACFEVIGVTAIAPYVAIINKPELIHSQKILSWLYSLFHVKTANEFVIVIGCCLILFYFLKNLALSFLYHVQHRFVFGQQARTESRLFRGYLSMPYITHLGRNSADILNVINTSVMYTFNYVLLPILMLVSESMVMLLIMAVLLIIFPLPTLSSIIVLGLMFLFFYKLIKSKLLAWGKSNVDLHYSLMKMVNEGLGGVKETKILGRESYFINNYTEESKKRAFVFSNIRTVNLLPRLFVETIMMVGIILIVIILLFEGKTLHSLVPILAIFAMAGFRLMPCMSRIIMAVSTVRCYTAAVDAVHYDFVTSSNYYNELQEENVLKNKGTLNFSNQLELKNICFRYPESKTFALDDIVLTIGKGSAVAFVGASGAGKSTLADIILGLLTPSSGNILLDGVNIKNDARGWQNKFGYIPQTIYLADDTVRRNVAFGFADNEIDDKKLFVALKLAQADEFISQLPDGLETMLGERGVRLSGGQKQRIGIARALYHDPEILVLDEATSALDDDTEQAVTNAIDSLSGKKTLIIIAHRKTTIKKCNVIFHIANGKLVNVEER